MTNGGTSFSNKTQANGLGSGFVFGVYAQGSTVYAALFSGGLGSGGLKGNTFINRTTADGLGSNGVYAQGNIVYAATLGGLSISTDGGKTSPIKQRVMD